MPECAFCPAKFDSDQDLLDHASDAHPEQVYRPSDLQRILAERARRKEGESA